MTTNDSAAQENYQLAGLVAFVVSGVFFMISAIQAGDRLAIASSVAWLVGCGLWLIPLVRRR
ncbi:MAG: hypothetical protein ACKVIY_13295 [Acidimicrobiales bacterium]